MSSIFDTKSNKGIVANCSVCNVAADKIIGGVCKGCDKCRVHREHFRCAFNHKNFTHHCPETTKRCESCQRCKKKCQCWECPKCNRKVVSDGQKRTKPCRAKTCKSCSNCCKCVKCLICFKVYKTAEDDKYCTGCKTCFKECRCPSVKMTQRDKISFLKSSSFKNNPIKRFISAEIEVAGCKKKKKHMVDEAVSKYCAVVKPDGSLPVGGFEINTAPANGDKWVEEITELCKALEEQEAFVNINCGLHVHIDARDMDYTDLRRLALIYAKVENELYSMCDANRKRSHYCRPCGPYYERYLSKLEKGSNASKSRSIESIIRGDCGEYDYSASIPRLEGRYHGLNLQAYWVHKTVECRIHHGSLSAPDIIKWGMLWAGLLEYSKNHSDLEVESLKSKGWELLYDIAPTDEIKFWVTEKAPKNKEIKAEVAKAS